MTPEQETIARLGAAGYAQALDLVAREHVISPRVIVGWRRYRNHVAARRALCVVLSETMDLTDGHIAVLLGRDRSSVTNLLKPHRREMRLLAERFQDAAE